MNKGIWLVLTVCMVLSLAVGSAYSRDNVASSSLGGVATFLDPGDPAYMNPWSNLNDGNPTTQVNVDWYNSPYQTSPTWQVDLSDVYAIDYMQIDSSDFGQHGSLVDDFVIELGLNGQYSPVASVRDLPIGGSKWTPHGGGIAFGPPTPTWWGFANDPGSNLNLLQIVETDSVRVTEFNSWDVDNFETVIGTITESITPHHHPRLTEIQGYNKDGGPNDSTAPYVRPPVAIDLNLSSDGTTLTWSPATGAVGYNVWISRADKGALSPDYFCVNQAPGPSVLPGTVNVLDTNVSSAGLVTGTSYVLPADWQDFSPDRYVVTSVDSTGTNSFYSDPAGPTYETGYADGYANGLNVTHGALLDMLPPGIRKNLEKQRGFAK